MSFYKDLTAKAAIYSDHDVLDRPAKTLALIRDLGLALEDTLDNSSGFFKELTDVHSGVEKLQKEVEDLKKDAAITEHYAYDQLKKDRKELRDALYDLSLKAALAVCFHGWPGDPDWQAGNDLVTAIEKYRKLSGLGERYENQ